MSCNAFLAGERYVLSGLVSRAQTAHSSARSLYGASVLIVDNNPGSLDFLVDVLLSREIPVIIARNGDAALELLDQGKPELILINDTMPGIDGFALTRLIKANARFLHLPVIFVSGISESGHVVQGLEAGGVDYVSNPVIFDQLFARLRVHLRNSRVMRSSQVALDLAGRPMIAVDNECGILWCTPRSQAMLASCFPVFARDRRLPDHVKLAFRSAQSAGGAAQAPARINLSDGWVEFTTMGHHFGNEWQFLISGACEGTEQRMLADRHTLTLREAEVLLWTSRGKLNREISGLLGISPRTVNRHLEHLFKKLGVKNRASAAAYAAETLSGCI